MANGSRLSSESAFNQLQDRLYGSMGGYFHMSAELETGGRQIAVYHPGKQDLVSIHAQWDSQAGRFTVSGMPVHPSLHRVHRTEGAFGAMEGFLENLRAGFDPRYIQGMETELDPYVHQRRQTRRGGPFTGGQALAPWQAAQQTTRFMGSHPGASYPFSDVEYALRAPSEVGAPNTIYSTSGIMRRPFEFQFGALGRDAESLRAIPGYGFDEGLITVPYKDQKDRERMATIGPGVTPLIHGGAQTHPFMRGDLPGAEQRQALAMRTEFVPGLAMAGAGQGYYTTEQFRGVELGQHKDLTLKSDYHTMRRYMEHTGGPVASASPGLGIGRGAGAVGGQFGTFLGEQIDIGAAGATSYIPGIEALRLPYGEGLYSLLEQVAPGTLRSMEGFTVEQTSLGRTREFGVDILQQRPTTPQQVQAYETMLSHFGLLAPQWQQDVGGGMAVEPFAGSVGAQPQLYAAGEALRPMQSGTGMYFPGVKTATAGMQSLTGMGAEARTQMLLAGESVKGMPFLIGGIAQTLPRSMLDPYLGPRADEMFDPQGNLIYGGEFTESINRAGINILKDLRDDPRQRAALGKAGLGYRESWWTPDVQKGDAIKALRAAGTLGQEFTGVGFPEVGQWRHGPGGKFQQYLDSISMQQAGTPFEMFRGGGAGQSLTELLRAKQWAPGQYQTLLDAGQETRANYMGAVLASVNAVPTGSTPLDVSQGMVLPTQRAREIAAASRTDPKMASAILGGREPVPLQHMLTAMAESPVFSGQFMSTGGGIVSPPESLLDVIGFTATGEPVPGAIGSTTRRVLDAIQSGSGIAEAGEAHHAALGEWVEKSPEVWKQALGSESPESSYGRAVYLGAGPAEAGQFGVVLPESMREMGLGKDDLARLIRAPFETSTGTVHALGEVTFAGDYAKWQKSRGIDAIDPRHFQAGQIGYYGAGFGLADLLKVDIDKDLLGAIILRGAKTANPQYTREFANAIAQQEAIYPPGDKRHKSVDAASSAGQSLIPFFEGKPSTTMTPAEQREQRGVDAIMKQRVGTSHNLLQLLDVAIKEHGGVDEQTKQLMLDAVGTIAKNQYIDQSAALRGEGDDAARQTALLGAGMLQPMNVRAFMGSQAKFETMSAPTYGHRSIMGDIRSESLTRITPTDMLTQFIGGTFDIMSDASPGYATAFAVGALGGSVGESGDIKGLPEHVSRYIKAIEGGASKAKAEQELIGATGMANWLWDTPVGTIARGRMVASAFGAAVVTQEQMDKGEIASDWAQNRAASVLKTLAERPELVEAMNEYLQLASVAQVTSGKGVIRAPGSTGGYAKIGSREELITRLTGIAEGEEGYVGDVLRDMGLADITYVPQTGTAVAPGHSQRRVVKAAAPEEKSVPVAQGKKAGEAEWSEWLFKNSIEALAWAGPGGETRQSWMTPTEWQAGVDAAKAAHGKGASRGEGEGYWPGGVDRFFDEGTGAGARLATEEEVFKGPLNQAGSISLSGGKGGGGNMPATVTGQAGAQQSMFPPKYAGINQGQWDIINQTIAQFAEGGSAFQSGESIQEALRNYERARGGEIMPAHDLLRMGSDLRYGEGASEAVGKRALATARTLRRHAPTRGDDAIISLEGVGFQSLDESVRGSAMSAALAGGMQNIGASDYDLTRANVSPGEIKTIDQAVVAMQAIERASGGGTMGQKGTLVSTLDALGGRPGTQEQAQRIEGLISDTRWGEGIGSTGRMAMTAANQRISSGSVAGPDINPDDLRETLKNVKEFGDELGQSKKTLQLVNKAWEENAQLVKLQSDKGRQAFGEEYSISGDVRQSTLYQSRVQAQTEGRRVAESELGLFQAQQGVAEEGMWSQTKQGARNLMSGGRKFMTFFDLMYAQRIGGMFWGGGMDAAQQQAEQGGMDRGALAQMGMEGGDPSSMSMYAASKSRATAGYGQAFAQTWGGMLAGATGRGGGAMATAGAIGMPAAGAGLLASYFGQAWGLPALGAAAGPLALGVAAVGAAGYMQGQAGDMAGLAAEQVGGEDAGGGQAGGRWNRFRESIGAFWNARGGGGAFTGSDQSMGQRMTDERFKQAMMRSRLRGVQREGFSAEAIGKQTGDMRMAAVELGAMQLETALPQLGEEEAGDINRRLLLAGQQGIQAPRRVQLAEQISLGMPVMEAAAGAYQAVTGRAWSPSSGENLPMQTAQAAQASQQAFAQFGSAFQGFQWGTGGEGLGMASAISFNADWGGKEQTRWGDVAGVLGGLEAYGAITGEQARGAAFTTRGTGEIFRDERRYGQRAPQPVEFTGAQQQAAQQIGMYAPGIMSRGAAGMATYQQLAQMSGATTPGLQATSQDFADILKQYSSGAYGMSQLAAESGVAGMQAQQTLQVAPGFGQGMPVFAAGATGRGMTAGDWGQAFSRDGGLSGWEKAFMGQTQVSKTTGEAIGGQLGAQYYMQQEQDKLSMAGLGVASAQLALTKQYTTGEGMPGGRGFWQIQDDQTKLQRAQATYSWQVAGQRMEMQQTQFAETFGANVEQFGIRTDWARDDQAVKGMQMARNQQWAREDWAVSDNVRNMQWGWQNEDFNENVRFASGRERQLMERGQERATQMHNIEGGQIETGRERQEEMWALEEEQFEKNKARFEEQTGWQEERFEREQRYFEETMALNEEAHEKDMEFMKRRWALEDEIRDMQREFQKKQWALQEASLGIQYALLKLKKEEREGQDIAKEQQMQLNAEQAKYGTAIKGTATAVGTIEAEVKDLKARAIELKDAINKINSLNLRIGGPQETQVGFSGLVSEPTMFLAGEGSGGAGGASEYVSVSRVGSGGIPEAMGQRDGGSVNVTVILDGEEIASHVMVERGNNLRVEAYR